MLSRSPGPLYGHPFTNLRLFTAHFMDSILSVPVTIILKETVTKGGPMPGLSYLAKLLKVILYSLLVIVQP